MIKKSYLPVSLFLGVFLLFCQPVSANWVLTLKEIYETDIPPQIRKNFSEICSARDESSECMLGVIDGECFFDIYPKRFLVLSLEPNSFGGIWAYIAVEGETRRTFRLWLYEFSEGEYDLRSIEELPNSMDELFFGKLHDPAHKPYWI